MNENKSKILKYVLLGVSVLAVLAILFAVAASKRTGSGNLFNWGDTIKDPNATPTAEVTASPTPSASTPASAGAELDDGTATVTVDDIPSELSVGDTASLDVTILPKSADQSWSVSSTDQNIVIAAKKDGKLYYRAMKSGTATVTLSYDGKSAREWKVSVKGTSSDSNSSSAGSSSAVRTSKPAATPSATPDATPTATPEPQDNSSEVVKAQRYASSIACDANVKPIDDASLIGKEEIEDASKYGAKKNANGEWVFDDINAGNEDTDASKIAKSGTSADAEPSPSASPESNY